MSKYNNKISYGARNLLVVAVAGCRGAGKSEICEKLASQLKDSLSEYESHSPINIEYISLEFYKKTINGSKKEKDLEENKNDDDDDENENERFAHGPDSYDFDKLISYIYKKKSKKYNEFEEKNQNNKEILIIEGSYALYNKKLRMLSNIKLYIHADFDRCIANTILNNLESNTESAIGLDKVISDYLMFERDIMENYIVPTRKYADIIISKARESIGLNLIVDGIRQDLFQPLDPAEPIHLSLSNALNNNYMHAIDVTDDGDEHYYEVP